MNDNHQIALFHRTLSELCRQGVPLAEAFRVLGSDLRGGPLHAAAAAFAEEVERGTPLGRAYRAREGLFPPLYAALVEAGIASGDLPGALEEIARHAAMRAEAETRIRRASAYPLVVAVVVFAIGGFLALGVLPRFGEMLAQLTDPFGNPLSPPLITRLFMDPMFGIALGIGIVGIFTVSIMFLRSPVEGARVPFGLRERLPFLGPLRLNAALMSFTGTVALLLRRGLPLHRALDLAAEAAETPSVRSAARAMAERARSGTGLADAARGAGLFPPSLVWLLASGEKSGSAATALEDLSGIFRDRVVRGVDLVTAVVGPAAEALLGAWVVFVLLAVLLPIFRIQAAFF